MKELPSHVKEYHRTPSFNENTIPEGILNSHCTKEGTWGKICVSKGKLLYTIEGGEEERVELTPEKCGVVEPEKRHHVEPLGEVEFHVAFFK